MQSRAPVTQALEQAVGKYHTYSIWLIIHCIDLIRVAKHNCYRNTYLITIPCYIAGSGILLGYKFNTITAVAPFTNTD